MEEVRFSSSSMAEEANGDDSVHVPSPARVFQILQDRLADNVYPAGEWLPTERELAQELEVNRSAVRDALLRLQHLGLIERKPGCRPRVSGSAPKSNTVVPTKASVRNVAVALPIHELDYASREIIRGISLRLGAEGGAYRPTLFDVFMYAHEPFKMEQQACDALLEGDAIGAIVWPTMHPQALDEWQGVLEAGHPVVFIDRFDDSMSGDFVGVDNYTTACDAVEYLFRLGHTRIAHLTTSESLSSITERREGYLDTMRKAGLTRLQSLWTISADDIPNVEAAIDRGIEADGLPTAIFAVNDDRAYRCIQHLSRNGISVPDQVSVIGVDDVDRFSPRSEFLTSMRQPFERIGHHAADMLLKRLKSGAHRKAAPNRHVLLSTPLIERGSCRSVS